MTQNNNLIQYITTAVDNGYKSLTPELRGQCDALSARVEALARVAAGVSDGAGVDVVKLLAQSQPVQDAVNVCLLIAAFAPTTADHAALREYVAAEAIAAARRVVERQKTAAK